MVCVLLLEEKRKEEEEMNELKTIEAHGVDEQILHFRNVDDIGDVMHMLEAGENFIVKWNEGKIEHAKLILATNLLSKVKTGEVTLLATKGGKQ